MHIHTDARTRQMYVHMSYTRAVGVSKTVIKGDGNSRPVGSKRRDRENVICRRPETNTCQKKPKKRVIATFRIPEVRMHIHTDARTRHMYAHRQLTHCHGPKSLPDSSAHAQQES